MFLIITVCLVCLISQFIYEIYLSEIKLNLISGSTKQSRRTPACQLWKTSNFQSLNQLLLVIHYESGSNSARSHFLKVSSYKQIKNGTLSGLRKHFDVNSFVRFSYLCPFYYSIISIRRFSQDIWGKRELLLFGFWHFEKERLTSQPIKKPFCVQTWHFKPGTCDLLKCPLAEYWVLAKTQYSFTHILQTVKSCKVFPAIYAKTNNIIP